MSLQSGRAMRFGVYLSQYFGPEYAPGSELVEQAQLLEDLGFDFVALGEHHLYAPGFLELLTTLSWLAARTQKIKICAAGFILPLYHPAMLAEMTATLHYLSGGRIIFGAVLGDWPPEFDLFGVPFEERAGRLEEGLEIVSQLLDGRTLTYSGKWFRLKEAFVSPPPERRPEIWLGARAPKAIQRAARLADGWICSVREQVDDLVAKVPLYRQAAASVARPSTVVIFRDGYVAESKETARTVIEIPLLELYDEYARISSNSEEAATLRQLTWETTSRRLLVGSPEEVIQQIRFYQDLGADAIMLRCQYPGVPYPAAVRSLRLFGTSVLPSFR